MDATVNARVTPMISGKNPQTDLAPGNALVAGMRLREFEITETLGEGGFSIVYGARDMQLMRDVAIKEYIPISLAGRVASTTVRIRSEHNRETFEAGLNGFINEARLLAQFKHPGLVEVLQFWEENGTAYIVMPRYTGNTLRSVLKEMGGKGDEPWLRGIVAPVLDVLEMLHSRNVFHRDIAPDNILIKNDGTPVLLDLGSAREVVTGLQKAITVVVKPGYAPIEQYSSDFALPQGPWTDVYAVGALLHFAIVGSPPPASISRIMKDSLQPLANAGLSGYSREFLTAVDRALALQPSERPQSIADLRALLRVTANDKTIINLTPPSNAPTPVEPAPALVTAPEAVESVTVSAPLSGGSEDERTVIVSAQEVAALVQHLAVAKAAAAAEVAVPLLEPKAAQSAAELAPTMPVSEPLPVPVSMPAASVMPPPFILPEPAAQAVLEPVQPVAAAEPAPDLVAGESATGQSASLAAATASEAAPAVGQPSEEKPATRLLSGIELTLEPMDRPEPVMEPEPLVVSESRLEPVSVPVARPSVGVGSDSDATVVMPVPRPPVETIKPAAKAVAPVKPAAAATSDATVVMSAPEAIALARSVAATAPTPAASADAPTIVLPSPVALAKPAPSALELDPLAMPSKHEKPESNSFPEMEDLLSGRLATEARPVVVPAAQPARSEAGSLPAAAATPARRWLVPVLGGSLLVVAATLLTWYLTAAPEPVSPPPIVAAPLTEPPLAQTPAPESVPPVPAEVVPASVAATESTPLPGTASDSNTLGTPSAQASPDPNAAPVPADLSSVSSMPADPAALPAAAPVVTTDTASTSPAAPVDPNQVLAPIAAPSETTALGFESPGQTIPPAVTAPPVETPAPAEPVAAATAAASKPPAADAVKTVDLTAAAPRSEESASRSRESATRAKREPNKVALAKTGNVKLSIQPWGEVWINGSLKGVSPPMRFLQLEPGTYNVELRNPGLQPLRRQLVVTAGQPVTIEHRFQQSAEGGAGTQ
ncbi:MAG: protein kinase [Rhodanobacteraceae bacterium]|nr:protein kinase [Rhodanobacteraceae bacterium]